MLSFNIYENSLYMIYNRGYSDIEETIKEISKEEKSDFIPNDRYQNIGFKYSKYLKSDIKDISDRFIMSYAVENTLKDEKQYVIFGATSSAFMNTFSNILLDIVEDTSKKHVINLIVSKDYTRIKPKIDLMNLSKNVRVFLFLDTEFEKPPFHAYMPYYELMKPEFGDEIIKSIYITKKKMKKLNSTELICRYLGFRSGDIVRVTRTPIIEGSFLEETRDYLLVD